MELSLYLFIGIIGIFNIITTKNKKVIFEGSALLFLSITLLLEKYLGASSIITNIFWGICAVNALIFIVWNIRHIIKRIKKIN
ncbi:MAG: hypothetical protein DBX47_07505 [Clostridiales bacterium]|nr:MAG: hypothetical protein DBX47_07505 [Clostridiales bacterium]